MEDPENETIRRVLTLVVAALGYAMGGAADPKAAFDGAEEFMVEAARRGYDIEELRKLAP